MDKLFSKLIKASLILTSSLFIFTAATASAADSTLDSMNSLATAPAVKTTIPGQAILIPSPPSTSSAGYLLLDTDSGKIIASKNANTRMPPASLTKLMTLYVASNALKSGQIHLTDQVRISKKAWQTGGSRMFVQVNELVSVEDLLKGVIVDSGNDACVALAEYIAGSEDAFVSLMNQEAQRLGMVNSHFTDCNGLPDPNHYSSPHDLAILARHLINDFPEYYGWYSQKSFAYNNITQSNRNRLLWIYPYADGLKTGHTDDAGYCLVASAKKNGMRLVSVVMGAPSDTARADDSVSLLTYGFNFFKTYKLYSAGETLSNPRVWKGKISQLPVGIAQNVYITLPIGQYKNLTANSVLNAPLMAPLTKGMKVGQLNLMVGDKTIMTLPLIALEDNPKGSYWSQISDSVMMSLLKMFHKETIKVETEEKQLI
ncbi:MAG: D-alanyl-D-alanine carboxypeptidase [Legionellales bacterium]|nr:D-alanyl-D-alanine carboxypeptidase [Legionellales bacterium]